ncbi:MAG: hypothetical protein ACRD3E_12625 [Terriglobales bacterium]
MKRFFFPLAFCLLFAAFAVAQDTQPTGTHQSPNEPNAVRPTKKHVRGNKAKASGSDEARGAKAAGHDVKTGHPVEAGKSIGIGTGRAAKDVAQGTDTEAHKGAHATKREAKKVGHSTKKAGRKITGKDKDRDDRTPPPQL